MTAAFARVFCRQKIVVGASTVIPLKAFSPNMMELLVEAANEIEEIGFMAVQARARRLRFREYLD